MSHHGHTADHTTKRSHGYSPSVTPFLCLFVALVAEQLSGWQVVLEQGLPVVLLVQELAAMHPERAHLWLEDLCLEHPASSGPGRQVPGLCIPDRMVDLGMALSCIPQLLQRSGYGDPRP